MSKLYLAYGSNLSVSQMMHRCPDAVIVGKASLYNWKLVFRYHATIEPHKDGSLPVLIWEISDRDEANLDRYEGFPKYYVKENISLRMTDLRGRHSKRVTAMAYIMTEGRQIEPPTSGYFQTIEAGYIRFGFSREILNDALEEALNHREWEERAI